MKYYIFNTEAEALAYDEAVVAVSNYQSPTTNWANPRKHPNREEWAIAASGKVVLEGQEPVELDESWTPPLDL